LVLPEGAGIDEIGDVVSNGAFQELGSEQQVRGNERFNIDQVMVVAPGGRQ